MESSRWSRGVTVAAVLMLALIAAVVSYAHMYELAVRHGEPEWRAALFPLSVDGMIVASSMALLSDAGQGRRGGVLPWTLLIIGSAASLAANIAVADPALWSRIIHSWPSFALIGAYELLMRQFRAGVRSECARIENAMRTQDRDSGVCKAEKHEVDPMPEGASGTEEYRRLRVVPAQAAEPESEVTEPVDTGAPAPQIQRDAWVWALENRREDGTLPSGKEIADRFAHKERWGRLVKQWGQQGRYDHAAA